MTTLGLDYAGGRPSPQAIKQAGFDFVVRYLSDGGPGLPGKLLTPDEAAGLLGAGVHIVSNWETTADRMLGGFAAGVYDATAARAQVLTCGGPGDRPIYFSADWDATPEQQGAIDDYLRGAASVLGPHNVGIYGGYWPASRALNDGTAEWEWQTDAWSGGNVDDRRKMHQRIGTVVIDGIECDVNEALVADYGQWWPDAAAEETEPGGEAMDQGYFKAYMDPVGSDVKDVREQLTGARDRIDNPDGTVDLAKSYPGWPQLGNRTLVDAVAAGLSDVAAMKAVLVALAGKLGVDLSVVAPGLADSTTAAAPVPGVNPAAQ